MIDKKNDVKQESVSLSNHPLATIVKALEYLKEEANRGNLEDAEMVIDCAFRLCLSMYFIEVRNGGGSNAGCLN